MKDETGSESKQDENGQCDSEDVVTRFSTIQPLSITEDTWIVMRLVNDGEEI